MEWVTSSGLGTIIRSVPEAVPPRVVGVHLFRCLWWLELHPVRHVETMSERTVQGDVGGGDLGGRP